MALRDAELWASLAEEGDYPAEELDGAWRTLLLHQFHDIIPGSGIHWVYEDTRRDHAEVERRAEAVTGRALADLSTGIDTGGTTHPVVVWNSLSHPRTGLVEAVVPDGTTVARDELGGTTPVQALGEGRALFLATVPSCGYAVYDLVTAEPDRAAAPVEGGRRHLQNEHLRVELDDDGLLVSVLDRSAGRQVLRPGTRGNLLQLHPDYPNFFDAWDIDAWYRDRVEEVTAVDSVEVVETGPLRAAVRVTRSFGRSSIAQTFRLTAGSPALEVSNEVDWHEENRLLKVAFPLAVHSPRATYEIQFGHVERPTHANTSWDAARFEVCAHRWADYSEPGYGAALLNDCKYGYDIRADVLRLSLLRAPNWPDPEADRGRHRFTYQLLPHAGDLRTAGVIDAGYDLNVPLRAVPAAAAGVGAGGSRSRSFLSVDGPNAVLEAVKRADDGSRALVVRLYEAWGSRGPVTLSAPWPVARASRTDLLEREEAPVECEGRAVRLRPRALRDPHPQAGGLWPLSRGSPPASARRSGRHRREAMGGAPPPTPLLVPPQECLAEGVLADQRHPRPPDGEVVGGEGGRGGRDADGWSRGPPVDGPPMPPGSGAGPGPRPRSGPPPPGGPGPGRAAPSRRRATGGAGRGGARPRCR